MAQMMREIAECPKTGYFVLHATANGYITKRWWNELLAREDFEMHEDAIEITFTNDQGATIKLKERKQIKEVKHGEER